MRMVMATKRMMRIMTIIVMRMEMEVEIKVFDMSSKVDIRPVH